MKRKIMYAAAILVATLTLNAQTPSLVWDRTDGGTANDEGAGITKAPNGYIYTCGSFWGTIMIGSIQLTAPTTDFCGFIAKHRPDGTPIWAKIYGDAKFPQDIAVAADGSIYTTGTGVGIAELFISRVDSNMNTIWEYKSSAGVNPGSGSWYPTNTGEQIMLDHAGNIITTGTFTDSLAIGATAVYAGNGSANAGYALKLNPSGSLIWAHKGKDGGDGFSVAVDQSDNAYFGYSYRDFSTSYIFSADIVKYSPSGAQLWLTRLDGVENSAIVTDNNNELYVAGYVRDTAMFSTTSYTPNASGETVVMELNASSGAPVWIKNFRGVPGFGGSNFLTSIGYSPQLGVVVFAYGNITINGTSYSGDDLFSFDSNGNINWTSGGPPGVTRDMWIDQADLYMEGYKTVGSSFDIYTAKMSLVSGIAGVGNTPGLKFYPNPATNCIVVDAGMTAPVQINIFNNLGQKVSEVTAQGKTTIELNLETGMYILQYQQLDKTYLAKLLVE